MGALAKIWSAIKGTVNNGAEAVIDANGITILEQEIREANEAIRAADNSLVDIIAKRKLSEKKVNGFKASIAEYEGNARAAMEKGNETLAKECALRVSQLRNEMNTEQATLEKFTQAENTQRKIVADSKAKIKQLESQVDIVKANDQVQKAQAATHSSVVGASSKTSTALDSLARIQAKQDEQAAKFEAQQELHDSETTDGLDQKLQNAGITGGAVSAEDELARIMGENK
ncbi:TPA: PspA/IM30 family protein [Vibrio parahaemolyticus]|uniref:PspA/IM30 family protein n=1 Tax=Vibrio campbellii TaxID=680 RepID=UPI001F07C2CD|nr:PspA/IM30 family protein [Vibrio campbellii]UMM06850.1 PspA/IM30 family protein [Vibrio campbellii]